MANRARGHRFSVLLIMLVAMVVATVVVMVVALDTGTARAATPTRATIEATSFTVDYLQTGEAFAVCPGTKRALGGGVVQSGSAVGPAGGLFVLASGPLDATGFTSETKDGDIAKQWYAAVFNQTGSTRTFKVFAICSNASNATIEATSLTVGHIQIGEAFAVCPGTKRALGGGVVQSGPANKHLNVRASGPLDATGFTSETKDGDVAKQWYAAVSNDSGSTRTFKVFAICSGASNATIEATSFTVGNFQTGEAFAVCPGTKRALGGGVVQSGPPFSIVVRASGPLDATGVTIETNDFDKAKQWYAAVFSDFHESGTRIFKTFAICE